MSVRALFRLSLTACGLVLLTAAVGERSAGTADPPPELSRNFELKFEPPAETGTSDSGTSRLVAGFRAFAAADMESAIALLDPETVAAEQRQLADWRLFIIAEASAALEDPLTSLAALGELTRKHPDSPAFAMAVQRAVEISSQFEQWADAQRWIDFARTLDLPRTRASQIEEMAWALGLELEDERLQTLAGRRLLTTDPLRASELGVEDYFRRPPEPAEWNELLTSEELQVRAYNLIEAGQPEMALETLAHVSAERRAFDWSLLQAQALTRDHRGQEALRILDDLASADRETQVEVLWQRALAADDASRVRRGRANLPESQRQEMALRSRGYLEQVIEVTADADRQRHGLRLLFSQVSDRDDSFDESVSLMRRLLEVDPADTAGTRYLWQRGWQAYVKRDYPVAIGYWSELESLYSGTNPARSGRYWTARAHDALGHPDRARDIYREVVAGGVDDFYSHHARARLGSADVASTSPPLFPTEPWPHDPVLARGRWLSDIGLQDLALLEIEGLGAEAEPRALWAQSAVILARGGERRESIQQLARAFPALGKAQQFRVPVDALQLYYPLDYRSLIEQRAREQNLSPYLVFAMIRQESAFDASARSWAGARGLMQLMPATGREVAQRLGLPFSTSRLEEPDFSIQLGTRYFRQVLDMFDGNEVLALAGYNGGPYRIKKLWRQAGSNPELDRFLDGLPLEETKTYVKRILLFQDSYNKLYAAGG